MKNRMEGQISQSSKGKSPVGMKIIGLLMSVVMVVSLMPAVAFAADSMSITLYEDEATSGRLEREGVSGSVIYAVIKSPSHGRVVVTPSNGFYIYTPESDYNGEDSFTYTYTYTVGGSTSAVQTVNITIRPVNDAPEVTTNNKIWVELSSEDNVISRTNLEVTDIDGTSPSDITFSLTEVPTNGILKKDGIALGVYGSFTQDDINKGKITYTHNGSDTDDDQFEFEAADPDRSMIKRTFYIGIEPATYTVRFVTQPATKTSLIQGSISGSLSASAIVSSSVTAALNWYACDEAGNISGNSLCTRGEFTIPTDLTAGKHYFLCRATTTGAVAASSNVATVIVNAKQYVITAVPTSITFGSAYPGYTQPAAQMVTLTNTGNQSITLTQPTAAYYDIGTLSKTTLAAGYTATFTITPKTGLGAGTYDERITVSGTNGASASVDVAFTVQRQSSVYVPLTPTVTIEGADKDAKGADTKYDFIKNILNITPEEGYLIKEVWVNGKSGDSLTELADIKGWDYVKIIVEKLPVKTPEQLEAERQARLTAGVKATRIIYPDARQMANGKVKLTWKKTKGYSLDFYQIYRSSKRSAGYKKAFTTENRYFITGKNLETGKKVFFKVRGGRKIDENNVFTNFSRVESVKIK